MRANIEIGSIVRKKLSVGSVSTSFDERDAERLSGIRWEILDIGISELMIRVMAAAMLTSLFRWAGLRRATAGADCTLDGVP